MSYGLQIFDAAGNVVLDTSTFTMKETGVFLDDVVNAGATIPVTGLTEDSVVFIANNNPLGYTSNTIPNVVISGNNLVISAPHAFNAQIRVLDIL